MLDQSEMLEIPNIDPDKVERYGKTFLKLIREAHRGYEAMIQQQEDRPQDPNHQNVIDISSDDEFGDADDLDEFDADEETLGESSHYFPSDDVNAFNAQRRLSQKPLYILTLTDSSHPTCTPSTVCSGTVAKQRV